MDLVWVSVECWLSSWECSLVCLVVILVWVVVICVCVLCSVFFMVGLDSFIRMVLGFIVVFG